MQINKKWIYSVIIFSVSFLLYAKTIGFDFSYFDDDDIIFKNSAFFEGSIDIQKIFTTDAYLSEDNYPLYRPLQNLSFAIDTQLAGGIHTWMFHLTNVLLFALLGCFLFFLFRRFNISEKMSSIGTLLFVVHPIFTMPVSWIPARGDLLLALFSILSMSFFIDFVRQQKYYQLVFSALFLLLALFSKETAALLPFVFLLYFFCFQEKPKIGKKHVLFGIILLSEGLFWLYLRSISINVDKTGFYYKNLLNIPTALSQLVVFPFDFSPLPIFNTVKTITGLLLLIFLLYIVYRKDEIPKKEKLLYISWFVLFLLPLFFHYQIQGVDYMDHRFLLPMVGVFALLLATFPKKWISGEKIIPVLIVIAVLSIVSLTKSNVYKNYEKFYGAAIKYDREKGLAYYGRGNHRVEINDIKGALDDYNNAILYGYKDTYKVFLNRGELKVRIGDLKGAMDDYNNSIIYGKDHTKSFLNRGILKAKMGDLKGAMDDYNRVIMYANKDDKALLFFNRGLVKILIRDLMGALDDINASLAIEPNNIMAYVNRAALYREFGDYEKALQECEMVLKVDPDNEWAIRLKNALQRR